MKKATAVQDLHASGFRSFLFPFNFFAAYPERYPVIFERSRAISFKIHASLEMLYNMYLMRCSSDHSSGHLMFGTNYAQDKLDC